MNECTLCTFGKSSHTAPGQIVPTRTHTTRAHHTQQHLYSRGGALHCSEHCCRHVSCPQCPFHARNETVGDVVRVYVLLLTSPHNPSGVWPRILCPQVCFVSDRWLFVPAAYSLQIWRHSRSHHHLHRHQAGGHRAGTEPLPQGPHQGEGGGPNTHTSTHTYTHARAHTRTHSHTQPHTPTQPHTQTRG